MIDSNQDKKCERNNKIIEEMELEKIWSEFNCECVNCDCLCHAFSRYDYCDRCDIIHVQKTKQ